MCDKPGTRITVYHLEMRSPDHLRPSTSAVSGFELRRAAIPSPAFSRFLYAGVGAGWNWYERLNWRYDQWLAYLDRPELETWVGYRHGTPAGYFELERQDEGDVEIVYFGLLPEFIGQGLGGLLLTEAVRRAWVRHTSRVWLHTCTLDHPYALRNYLARGFRIFRHEEHVIALPETLPDVWPNPRPNNGDSPPSPANEEG
jgi:GNAT superfamily N-acetyltransferase